MRILLVEDDPEQIEPLHDALARSGHIVDAVEDGATAQWLMGEKDYDLLIFDWMLPDEDGIFLCQQYRQGGKAAPILMLTAKDTTVDKVMGLDAGADDYLVKPVDNPIEEEFRSQNSGVRIKTFSTFAQRVEDRR